MQVFEYPHDFVINRKKLEERVRKSFDDHTITIEQADEAPFGSKVAWLIRSTDQEKQELPGRPIATLYIKEHLGGGAQPLAKIDRKVLVNSDVHNRKIVGIILANEMLEEHLQNAGKRLK